MKIGYARVSTKEQTTARQIDAFRAEGVDEIVEEHASGKDFEGRSAYQELRQRLVKGDMLVVMSLDRFGRNYDEIISEWRYLVKKVGVDIKVIDMPIIDTTQGGGLVGRFVGDIVLQILAFVAQNERETILRRQEQGIEAAMARGVRFGRPETKLPDNFDAICAEVTEGRMSMREAALQTGLAKSVFCRCFHDRGCEKKNWRAVSKMERFAEVADAVACGKMTFAEAARELNVYAGMFRYAFEKCGRRVEITACVACGKPIEPTGNARGGRAKKYCAACAKFRQVYRTPESREKKTIGVEIVCAVCGKTFTAKNFRGQAPKYCSKECRRKSRKTGCADAEPQKIEAVQTVRAENVISPRRQVERDLQLPASERYEASKKWTAEQRAYAKKLWNENHKGRWE